MASSQAAESERAAIVANEAMTSHLVELILLPEENEDVMPPFGKPQLESDETVAIIRWINRGAPLGDYEPPVPVVKEVIEIDLASADSDAAGVVAVISTDELMETLFETLIEDIRLALVGRAEGASCTKSSLQPSVGYR